MSFAKKAIKVLAEHKKYWLWPVIVAAMLAVVMMVSVHRPASAPFQYNIF